MAITVVSIKEGDFNEKEGCPTEDVALTDGTTIIECKGIIYPINYDDDEEMEIEFEDWLGAIENGVKNFVLLK